MERKEVLENGFIIKEVIEKNNTKIYLYNPNLNETVLISDIQTTENSWVKYVVKNNYLVIYSSGVIASEIPVNLKTVFDMEHIRFLDIDDELIKSIFIYGKQFSLATVLSTINDKYSFVEEKEVEEFIDYLTNNNESIMSEDIKNYIFENYPELENYTNIDPDISRYDANEIVKKFGYQLWFNIMPLVLEYENNGIKR